MTEKDNLNKEKNGIMNKKTLPKISYKTDINDKKKKNVISSTTTKTTTIAIDEKEKVIVEKKKKKDDDVKTIEKKTVDEEEVKEEGEKEEEGEEGEMKESESKESITIESTEDDDIINFPLYSGKFVTSFYNVGDEDEKDMYTVINDKTYKFSFLLPQIITFVLILVSIVVFIVLLFMEIFLFKSTFMIHRLIFLSVATVLLDIGLVCICIYITGRAWKGSYVMFQKVKRRCVLKSWNIMTKNTSWVSYDDIEEFGSENFDPNEEESGSYWFWHVMFYLSLVFFFLSAVCFVIESMIESLFNYLTIFLVLTIILVMILLCFFSCFKLKRSHATRFFLLQKNGQKDTIFIYDGLMLDVFGCYKMYDANKTILQFKESLNLILKDHNVS